MQKKEQKQSKKQEEEEKKYEDQIQEICNSDNKFQDIQDDQSDDNLGNVNLQCRFYRNEWPEINDLVIVSTNINTLKVYLNR